MGHRTEVQETTHLNLSLLVGKHGQADQEPLGEAHHPGLGSLYVAPDGDGYPRPNADVKRTDQIAAGIEGFFWPKIFWDFLTKTLDPAVKPIPVLQIINVLFGLILLAWEWPLGALAGSSIHRSLEARLAFLPLTALAAALTYQGTNAAIYQVIGLAVYFWAYSEGEVRFPLHPIFSYVHTNLKQMICAQPWTLPKRGGRGARV